MKSNLCKSTLALLALGFALGLHAQTQPALSSHCFGEIVLDQVAAVVHANGDTVTPGTSRIMVSARLGSPDAVLPDGSWLYHGYDVRCQAHAPVRTGTLVVRFVANQVSSLTIADQATVVALRQAPRKHVQDRILAANQTR